MYFGNHVLSSIRERAAHLVPHLLNLLGSGLSMWCIFVLILDHARVWCALAWHRHCTDLGIIDQQTTLLTNEALSRDLMDMLSPHATRLCWMIRYLAWSAACRTFSPGYTLQLRTLGVCPTNLFQISSSLTSVSAYKEPKHTHHPSKIVVFETLGRSRPRKTLRCCSPLRWGSFQLQKGPHFVARKSQHVETMKRIPKHVTIQGFCPALAGWLLELCQQRRVFHAYAPACLRSSLSFVIVPVECRCVPGASPKIQRYLGHWAFT